MVVVVESVHGSSRGRIRLAVVAVVVKQVGAGLSSKCQVHHLERRLLLLLHSSVGRDCLS